MKTTFAATFAVAFSLAAPALALDGPTGIAVDLQGNVYVVNSASPYVAVYNAQMKLTGALSTGLANPVSVAANSAGRVFVADLTQNAVLAYDPGQTSPVLTITQYVSTPTNVRVGPYDDVWVENYGGQVHVFDSAGFFYHGENSPGTVVGFTLAPPFLVEAGSNLSGTAGNVRYENAADTLNGQAIVTGEQILPGNPADLAYDSMNRLIWFADRGGHIGSFSMTGSYTTMNVQSLQTDVVAISSPPWGIAVDPIRGRLYVTEPGANRVEVFSTKTHARIGVLL